jgi:hypothetical protein
MGNSGRFNHEVNKGQKMNAVFIRIALRYLAMALVVRGWLSAEDSSIITSDPDVAMLLEMGLGLGIAGAVELWHWITLPFKEARKAADAVTDGKTVIIKIDPKVKDK